MDNKQKQVEEEIKKHFQSIVEDSRTHPIFPIRPKCNDCKHMIPRTAKCSLLYPNGIPHQIMINKENCKEFKQK